MQIQTFDCTMEKNILEYIKSLCIKSLCIQKYSFNSVGLCRYNELITCTLYPSLICLNSELCNRKKEITIKIYKIVEHSLGTDLQFITISSL